LSAQGHNPQFLQLQPNSKASPAVQEEVKSLELPVN